jgi:hypothetical protein
MIKIHPLLKSILIVATIACMGTCYANNTKKEPARFLFLQKAYNASLRDDGINCYELKLTKLNPILDYFSEEPLRIVGTLTTERYLQLWKKDPKERNMALHGFDATQEKSYSLIATISNPQYDKNLDQMTYHTCLTDATVQKPLSTNQLTHVILFIDPLDPDDWLP